jgi:hypothetical protein
MNEIKIIIEGGFIQFFVDGKKINEQPLTPVLLMKYNYSYTLDLNGDKVDFKTTKNIY